MISDTQWMIYNARYMARQSYMRAMILRDILAKPMTFEERRERLASFKFHMDESKRFYSDARAKLFREINNVN